MRTRILLLLLTGQACCCRSLSLLPAAVGDCYSQDVFSCKVDIFSNRISAIDPYANWPKSLLSLQIIFVGAAHSANHG